MELYLAPGVQHCGGGSGADAVDLLTPLQGWVESGQRPTDLIAQKTDQSGKVTFSRPLCRHPAIPQYQGGDVNAAGSFTCQNPKPAPA